MFPTVFSLILHEFLGVFRYLSAIKTTKVVKLIMSKYNVVETMFQQTYCAPIQFMSV